MDQVWLLIFNEDTFYKSKKKDISHKVQIRKQTKKL